MNVMQPRFSAYLDIVRFLAAFTVFLGHAAGKYWTGGFLWPTGAYGDTCVVIFFVLSGFVIAYVTDNKERAAAVYASNRIARLWSVVIPALALTFVIDYFGVQRAPELYIGQPWFAADHPVLRYLASFFMLQEAWHIAYTPGINAPFWSLSYEAFYYLAFGLMSFYKGRGKWLAMLAVFLVGGPLVLVLFPIWMLGVVAYRQSKTWRLSVPAAWAAFLVGGIVLLFSPHLRAAMDWTFMGQDVLGRYVDAAAFVLHLAGAYCLLAGKAPLPAPLGMAIKRVASTTFVLYLFHRPLIQLFSYIGAADPSSWQRRVLVIGATLAVVALATPLCERLQSHLRAWCLRLLGSKGVPGPARNASVSHARPAIQDEIPRISTDAKA